VDDSFFFYDPKGERQASRCMPFATMVTKDYDGFDTASDLNRPGIFRLNIAVGRQAFERRPPTTPLPPPVLANGHTITLHQRCETSCGGYRPERTLGERSGTCSSSCNKD
jgi:hypothetical protein